MPARAMQLAQSGNTVEKDASLNSSACTGEWAAQAEVIFQKYLFGTSRWSFQECLSHC